jgi:aspartate/methionine/tyrosine aminotransferase
MGDRKLNRVILSIPESGINKVADLADKIPGCIRFDIGEPNFDMPIHLKQAAIKAIEEGFTHYTSNFGILELRKAIAKKERQENRTNLSEDNVIVTPGGIGGLFCILKTILNPDDEVLIPDPSWAPYNLVIRVSHGRSVWTEFVKENNVDIDILEENVTKKTKAIIVNSPSNPTGRVLRKNETEKIVGFAVEHDLFIISDEVYEKIIFDGISHYSFGRISEIFDRLFLINSFSKTYAMTGLRVGYVVAEEKFIKEMGKVNRAITACVNSIAQKVALTALQGSQDCVEEMKKEYEERRDLIVNELKSMGLEFMKPMGTFYIFPDVNENSERFSAMLLKKQNVATVPGIVFGPSGKNAVRISFGSCTKEQIIEGVEGIKKLIKT